MKPRKSRSPSQDSNDPVLFLRQVATHEKGNDRRIEIAADEVTTGRLEELIYALDDGFALAVSSRVKLKDGSVAHIPMMDFKCGTSAENIEIARTGLELIGQTSGVILNSGESFHFYGNTLLDEVQWRMFLARCLLLNELVDTRYIGHTFLDDECRLRISPGDVQNPFIPQVVDVF